MYEAALARSEADWVVGINATRALTTKYDAQLSLGRVQTPTIQLVQSRQNEINEFKPQTYYTLSIKVDGLSLILIPGNVESPTNKTVKSRVDEILK